MEEAIHYLKLVTEQDLARFWGKVNIGKKNECWEWNGSLKGRGYGGLGLRGKTQTAHRISYFLFYGEIDDQMQVLHKCGNKKCVNPLHLRLGTALENYYDMIVFGEYNSPIPELNKKLSDCDVVRIREKYATEKYKMEDIANQYGISVTTVCRFVLGRARLSAGGPILSINDTRRISNTHR